MGVLDIVSLLISSSVHIKSVPGSVHLTSCGKIISAMLFPCSPFASGSFRESNNTSYPDVTLL